VIQVKEDHVGPIAGAQQFDRRHAQSSFALMLNFLADGWGLNQMATVAMASCAAKRPRRYSNPTVGAWGLSAIGFEEALVPYARTSG
jgi:hypothetical protein